MPGLEFFRNAGLFVGEDFLDRQWCTTLRSEMAAAHAERAKIIRDGVEGILDENTRRVRCPKLRGPCDEFVYSRFQRLLPDLERHFGVELEDSQAPEYLIYDEGGFYKPHTDVGPDSWTQDYRRHVSAVAFLNDQASEPADGCYGGGSLTFHGIFADTEWARCAFALDAAAGTVVAFRSQLWHEVRPVMFGRRFTIATWFVGDRS